jgi:DNA-binding CsgD family transcriptional regulator
MMSKRLPVSPGVYQARLSTARAVEPGKHHLAEANVDILNLLKVGAMVINSSFEIIHANPAARALMCEGSFLSVENGRLLFSERTAAASIREAFVISDENPDNCGSSHIFMPADGTIFHLRVAGLAAKKVDPKCTRLRRSAIIFVQKIDLDNGSAIALIEETFQLTAAECRVLIAIVEIGGVPEVARHLAVAETTIKTHLQRVFVKTNTRRQADLARLVTAISGCRV